LVRDVPLLPDLSPLIYDAFGLLLPPSLPSSSGLGRRPLTAKTGVRVPLGAPKTNGLNGLIWWVSVGVIHPVILSPFCAESRPSPSSWRRALESRGSDSSLYNSACFRSSWPSAAIACRDEPPASAMSLPSVFLSPWIVQPFGSQRRGSNLPCVRLATSR
jgi:hypothetical protein